MKATKILIVLIVLSSIHLTAQLTSFQRVEYDNVKGKYIVYADALDGTPDKVFWNDYYKSSNLKLKQFDILFSPLPLELLGYGSDIQSQALTSAYEWEDHGYIHYDFTDFFPAIESKFDNSTNIFRDNYVCGFTAMAVTKNDNIYQFEPYSDLSVTEYKQTAIYLNNTSDFNYNWTTDVNDLGTINARFKSVYLHEFGHLLWIGHSYRILGQPANVMNAGNPPYQMANSLTSTDIEGIAHIYQFFGWGATGIEDGIELNGPVYLNQNSSYAYSAIFVDVAPLGDYVVGGYNWKILLRHAEGEYQYSTGTAGSNEIWNINANLGAVPTGYCWYRDANNNVIGRLKVTGTDNDGIVHTSEQNIYVSGVANNTTNGTLPNNETWCGTMNITGNVTVPSGITLKILPGTDIRFQNNSSLIVNGGLNVNGTSMDKITFDFITPNATIQNGIKVNSGGSINISHSIVKNGYKVINVNQGVASIDNCEVTNCSSHGIYLYGTDYTSSQPVITNCNIHGNTNGCGIAMYYSSPLLIGNEIYNNFISVGVANLSQPDFGNLGNYGNNNIHNNSSQGVYAIYYGSPFLGRDACETQGGRNILENNSYHELLVASNVAVLAEKNWWGSDPPNSSKITSFYNTIDYDPWLSSSPSQQFANMRLSPEENLFNTEFHQGENIGVDKTIQKATLPLDPNISLINKLGYAKRQIDLKHYKTAQLITKEIIEKYPDSSAAFLALGMLWRASKEDDIESFKVFLKNLGLQKTKNELFGAAEIIEADFEKNNRVAKLNTIINKYKDTKTAEFGYFNLFLYYVLEEDNKAKAKETGDLIISLFPNSPAAIEVNDLLNINIKEVIAKPVSSNKINLTNNELPTEYKLLGNYPNPFNPSTTINYALPVQSNVEINIFDVMGRLIRSFVISSQNAGYQNVIWNGKNENNEQIASGIYLYRFKAVSTDGKVFEKTSKLLMLK